MTIPGEEKVPDTSVVFVDGFLYIISRKETYSLDVLCLNVEYDEPITLADIAMKYPNVVRVVYEGALRGYVYTYGNHDKGVWEQTGKTIGYA